MRRNTGVLNGQVVLSALAESTPHHGYAAMRS